MNCHVIVIMNNEIMKHVREIGRESKSGREVGIFARDEYGVVLATKQKKTNGCIVFGNRMSIITTFRKMTVKKLRS